MRPYKTVNAYPSANEKGCSRDFKLLTKRRGSCWRATARRSGIKTPSSAFSSTGASTPCPPSITSGIRAICTCRVSRAFEHHRSHAGDRKRSSATRISSRCSQPRSSTRRRGRRCSRRRARSMSSRWPSITTASPCTTARSRAGTPPRWGPKRDVIGELAGGGAPRGAGLRRVSHRAEHWWFMNGGRTFDSDVQSRRLRQPLRPGHAGPRRGRRSVGQP